MNQLKDSAHRVGYEVQYVDFISMLSPSNRNVDSIRELFEDALRNIKPDLVLFGSSDSYVYPFFKGINPEFVTEMRKSLSKSFSLVNVCGDLWRKADQESIQNWSEACNLFLHLDEYSMNRLSNRVREKALFYPFIGLNEFPARNRDRDYILFYSGQVRDSDRRIILNRVLKKFAQTNVLDINFKVHFSWTEKSALTELEYQQNMSNSDFCLSFAQKGPDHFLIPWRSLEALSAGCTLIHQEHPEFKPLSRIAVPFQHYLSFQNEVDLLNLLNEIKSNPASYREIGRKARLFWRERYSDWDLWNSINNKLENDLGL
jgi:hypothetical protein